MAIKATNPAKMGRPRKYNFAQDANLNLRMPEELREPMKRLFVMIASAHLPPDDVEGVIWAVGNIIEDYKKPQP